MMFIHSSRFQSAVCAITQFMRLIHLLLTELQRCRQQSWSDATRGKYVSFTQCSIYVQNAAGVALHRRQKRDICQKKRFSSLCA